MAISDPSIAGWAADRHVLHTVIPAIGAIFVVAVGKWLTGRQQQPEAANQAAG